MVQAITFRLADSLPAKLRSEWHGLLPVKSSSQRSGMQAYLDRGRGSCVLRNPEVAKVVEGSFLFGDGPRYRLLAWVVMPNHVYVVVEMVAGVRLASIVQGWKSFTAHRVNRMLHRQGPLWSRDYYDRYIRDEDHLRNAILYVHNNPVLAGLVKDPGDWPFSSARYAQAPDVSVEV